MKEKESKRKKESRRGEKKERGERRRKKVPISWDRTSDLLICSHHYTTELLPQVLIAARTILAIYSILRAAIKDIHIICISQISICITCAR